MSFGECVFLGLFWWGVGSMIYFVWKGDIESEITSPNTRFEYFVLGGGYWVWIGLFFSGSVVFFGFIYLLNSVIFGGCL